jgi:hypothetical protein
VPPSSFPRSLGPAALSEASGCVNSVLLFSVVITPRQIF